VPIYPRGIRAFVCYDFPRLVTAPDLRRPNREHPLDNCVLGTVTGQ
jgi:hypothetical protein